MHINFYLRRFLCVTFFLLVASSSCFVLPRCYTVYQQMKLNSTYTRNHNNRWFHSMFFEMCDSQLGLHFLVDFQKRCLQKLKQYPLYLTKMVFTVHTKWTKIFMVKSILKNIYTYVLINWVSIFDVFSKYNLHVRFQLARVINVMLSL